MRVLEVRRSPALLAGEGRGLQIAATHELEYRRPLAAGFRAERLALSPGGQYLSVSGTTPTAAEGARGRLYCVDLAPLARYRGRDSAVRCRAVELGDSRLAAQRSLRPLQLRWHPRSAHHLAVLLEDALTGAAAFHLYSVEQGEVSVPEQEFALRPDGPFGLGVLDYADRKTRLVDFAFGPALRWGHFAVVFLAASGAVFSLCPIAPFGASFPRAQVVQLFEDLTGGEPDAEAATEARAWLERAFPRLFGASAAAGGGEPDRDGRYGSLEAEAHRAVLDGLAPVLIGPLRSLPELRGPGSPGAPGRPAALSVALVGGSSGYAALAALDSASTVTVHVLGGDPAPAWAAAAPSCIFRAGELVAYSVEVGATAVGAPSLLHIDTIELAAEEDRVAGDRPRAADPANQATPRVIADPNAPGQLYCHHARGVHVVGLTWLPGLAGSLGRLQSAVEAGGVGDSERGAGVELPAPTLSTLLHGDIFPLATALVTDRLGASSLVTVDADPQGVASAGAEGDGNSCGVDVRHCRMRFLHAPELSTSSGGGSAAAPGPHISAGDGPPSAAPGGLRELGAWYQDLVAGPAATPFPRAADAVDPAAPEGRRYVHECIAVLTEKHLRYAHRVHGDFAPRAGAIGAEHARQEELKEELRLKLRTEAAKMKATKARLNTAAAMHANLVARAELLAELEHSLPLELSAAEAQAKADFRGLGDLHGRLSARIRECKRRSDLLLKQQGQGELRNGRPQVRPALPSRATEASQLGRKLVATADTVDVNLGLVRELRTLLGRV